jgi:hypothetical protein
MKGVRFPMFAEARHASSMSPPTHKRVTVIYRAVSSTWDDRLGHEAGSRLGDSVHEHEDTLFNVSESSPLLDHGPYRQSTLFSFVAIMEKVRNSRLAYWADKLAVDSEPGLTNAQVLLPRRAIRGSNTDTLSLAHACKLRPEASRARETPMAQ